MAVYSVTLAAIDAADNGRVRSSTYVADAGCDRAASATAHSDDSASTKPADAGGVCDSVWSVPRPRPIAAQHDGPAAIDAADVERAERACTSTQGACHFSSATALSAGAAATATADVGCVRKSACRMSCSRPVAGQLDWLATTDAANAGPVCAPT
eukprot:scaffold198760_cov28-Tisochrysis_lutea.AAC.3